MINEIYNIGRCVCGQSLLFLESRNERTQRLISIVKTKNVIIICLTLVFKKYWRRYADIARKAKGSCRRLHSMRFISTSCHCLLIVYFLGASIDPTNPDRLCFWSSCKSSFVCLLSLTLKLFAFCLLVELKLGSCLLTFDRYRKRTRAAS